MGTEAIVIPIVIDPRAGVAGLKALGDQAATTNKQFDQGTSSSGKFGESMRNAAKNALAMLGAMNLMDHAVKFLVRGIVESIASMGGMTSATKLLAKAQDEAVASTKKEVIELQTLFSIAKDTTLSYGQRQTAIDKLNKMMPDHLNNLRLETIGNQNVADAIQNVIDNMVKRAKADILLKQIVDLSNALDDLKKGSNVNVVNRAFLKMIPEVEERIKTLTAEMNKLMRETIGTKSGFDALFGGAKGLKVSDLKVTPGKIKIDASHAGDIDMIGGEQAVIKLPPASAKAAKNISPDFIGRPVTPVINEVSDALQRQADLISNVLSPAFEGMFDAILSKQNAIKAFFQSMVQAIKQVIKQLIAAVVQAGILSLLTGGAGKGGLSFGKALGKILGFAEGGLVTGPVASVIGEGRGTNAYNPEVVTPLDKLKLFFKDMMTGNRSYMASSNMGTANAFINVPKEVILRGQGRDLFGVMTLEQASQGRIG